MNLFNHDGVYFDVTSDDVKFETIAREDVVSLEITEEMAKMDTGTLTLNDPNNIYSRIIRPGARLKLSWGIRDIGIKPISREALEVLVNSPSGGGAANGVVTFNCSFTALGFRGENSTRWYETGTKADVISEVMDRLGILTTNKEIDFQRGAEKITGGTKVAQYESDFRFLVRMADEWRAAFKIGQTPQGQPVACFLDYSKLSVSKFAFKVGGLDSVYLEYGSTDLFNKDRPLTGNQNVLSYSWQDKSLDSANGQGAQIIMVDGQPQIYRTIIEGETVTTWRLDVTKIEKELGTKDLMARTDLLNSYLTAKTFDEVKRFFVKEENTTYPEGSGIIVSPSVIGNPNITCGMLASFGGGFPDRVGAKDRTWWIRKATHKISTAGYFTDMEIVDAYTFSPTGVKLAPVGSTR